MVLPASLHRCRAAKIAELPELVSRALESPTSFARLDSVSIIFNANSPNYKNLPKVFS